MKIHFIAVGGTIMHDLAIVLKERGYEVTGSDDEIFEPSYSKLKSNGLLPEAMGWHPKRIHASLDAVIVGMHARKDNPELLKAQELGIKTYSFPAFIHQEAANKQRIVVAGSHGKTTVTSMILHVLHYWGKNLDFLVGAMPANSYVAINGSNALQRTLKLEADNPYIVLEGDEYPSSALDSTPKFLHYQHHIGIITGIAWDHINAFPTEENYVDQFRKFIANSCKAGTLIYFEEDKQLAQLIKETPMVDDVVLVPYRTHPYEVKNGQTYLIAGKKERVLLKVFGAHNMQNLSAAFELCKKLSIKPHEFYEAIQSFEGASRRLEKIGESANTAIFRDFAHSPSKLKATVEAVKQQYLSKRLVACLELHTYSSLNKDFLPQYQHCFSDAEIPVVYFNPETLRHKKMDAITEDELKALFANEKLRVFTDSKALEAFLLDCGWKDSNLLLMSSGTFNSMDVQKLAKAIIEKSSL